MHRSFECLLRGVSGSMRRKGKSGTTERGMIPDMEKRMRDNLGYFGDQRLKKTERNYAAR